MADIARQIADYVDRVAYRPVKPRELAQAIGVGQPDYAEFRRAVRRMIADGELVRLRGGRVGPPEKMNFVRGSLDVIRSGAAFVVVEGGTDLFIPADELGVALPGDTVLARVESERERRGSVERVIKRAREHFVGTYHRSRTAQFVKPDDRRIARDFYVPADAMGGAEPGQKVVVRLDEWSDPWRNPTARVVEVLGFPDDPGVDVLAVIHEFNLPTEYPAGALDEASAIPDAIPDRESARRVDLRGHDVIVIDPADARDHDDGVSVEKTAHGWRVGVHIADVSNYVPEGSALDGEASARGCTVYLVDRAIPMLPERLSADLCSLLGEDRLALSCLLEVDPDGRVRKSRVVESVIRPCAVLTYDQVQRLFDGKPAPEAEPFAGPLRELLAVSDLLRERRMERGSLDFDLPEAHVTLGPQGQVIDAGVRVRLPSHRLIEECMLAANRAVAEKFVDAGVPTLFRVHDRPPEEQVEKLREVVAEFGVKLKTARAITPKQVQRILAAVEDTKVAPYIHQIVLRAMAKAEYSPRNIGHFGLAFDHYLHFTSPIRRYPDLVVHRILKELLNGTLTAKRQISWRDALPGIGRLSSERERVADQAERRSVRIKQVQFLATRLGDEYEGVISGAVARGFFVTLDELQIDGFVRVEEIGDDFYRLDETGHKLVGRRTRRTFRLGDPVRVQIVRADTESGMIDFRLVGGGTFPEKTRRKRR